MSGVFRLLDEARVLGLVFSVYATPRTLAAYPSFADFVAGEGQRMLATPAPSPNGAWPIAEGHGDWWIRLKPDAEARAIRKKLDRIARKNWSLG